MKLSLKLRHLYLFFTAALCAAWYLCRGNRAWMNLLADRAVLPMQAALGRLSANVPFSLMEVLTAAAVLTALCYVLYTLSALWQAAREACSFSDGAGRVFRRFYSLLITAACVGLTVFDLFCFQWGTLFWTDSFQDLSGLRAAPVAAEDLYAVTARFAEELAQAAGNVARDRDGLFAVDRSDILRDAPEAYRNLEQVWPFLTFEGASVKPMFFSRLMSEMDFTGFYCSYTGEANVNVDSPACLLPATAAHEMAHQRGIASEQECNFLGILACVTSGNPVYEYAGYLMGYIYLGNALWQSDRTGYRTLWESLPETVHADLRYNSAYWDQFRDTVVNTVSTKVYDGILKTYGEERGIRSYGDVVDLLVAYYRGAA